MIECRAKRLELVSIYSPLPPDCSLTPNPLWTRLSRLWPYHSSVRLRSRVNTLEPCFGSGFHNARGDTATSFSPTFTSGDIRVHGYLGSYEYVPCDLSKMSGFKEKDVVSSYGIRRDGARCIYSLLVGRSGQGKGAGCVCVNMYCLLGKVIESLAISYRIIIS